MGGVEQSEGPPGVGVIRASSAPSGTATAGGDFYGVGQPPDRGGELNAKGNSDSIVLLAGLRVPQVTAPESYAPGHVTGVFQQGGAFQTPMPSPQGAGMFWPRGAFHRPVPFTQAQEAGLFQQGGVFQRPIPFTQKAGLFQQGGAFQRPIPTQEAGLFQQGGAFQPIPFTQEAGLFQQGGAFQPIPPTQEAGLFQQRGAFQRHMSSTQGGGQLNSWLPQQGSVPPFPYGAAPPNWPPPPSLPTQPTAHPIPTTQ